MSVRNTSVYNDSAIGEEKGFDIEVEEKDFRSILLVLSMHDEQEELPKSG